MEATGWFADTANVDDPLMPDERFPWQPCLQLEGARCFDFQIWFATEEECVEFIKDEILGKGMYPE